MKHLHLVLIPALTAILCGFLFYAGGALGAFAAAFTTDIPPPVVLLARCYPAAPLVAVVSVGLSLHALRAGESNPASLRANWILLFLMVFMSAYGVLGMALSSNMGASD